MKTSFPVTLSVVTNHATGETFILPELADIEAVAQLARTDFEAELSVRRETTGEAADAQEQLRSAFIAGQTAEIARIKSEREALLPYAVKHEFTLVLPDYGTQRSIAAESVRKNETTGDAIWDEAAYRALLLKNGLGQNGRTLSPQEVDALPCVLGEELAARMVRAVRRDNRRATLLLPSSTVQG